MRFKSPLWLLCLLPLTLFAFQNCGSFAAVDPSAKAASNLGSTGGGDMSESDGLPAGLSQAGSIFTRDPGTSAGSPTLSFTADLSPYTTSVAIKHLKSGAALNNGYANFAYDDANPTTFAYPSSSLVFAPTDPRFDQVNAYYHVDRLIADLTGLNLFPSPYPLLKVNTHCTQDGADSNAFYSFDDHTLCLGYTDISSQRIWAAQDADVVVHEFGHSLNHKYTPDETWSSSSDNGAMDEGFADLWAYRQNRDHRIAMWFGRAIYVAAGYTYYNSSIFPGLRDLDHVNAYPTAVAFEVHDDSEFISAAVKEIEVNSAMSSANMAKFEKRLIESLQYGHGFADVVTAIQDNAPSVGASSAIVSAALTSRGLLRKDLVADVSLDTMKPFYIVDNHNYSDYQVGGNCNAGLDAGETVLLFPNLRNAGSIKGGVRVSLSSADSFVRVVAGGDVAYFARLPATTTFLAGELGSAPKTGSTYQTKLLGGSFSIKASSSAVSGSIAHLTLTVTTMNTVDSTSQTKTIPINVTIGSVATQPSACSGSGETSVWP